MTDPVQAAEKATTAAAQAEAAAKAKAGLEAEEASAPSITATAHDVTLERSNNEKIAIECVRDWEIPILQAVHGPDRVVIRETYDIDLTGEDTNPAREYQRLKAKYNRRGNNVDVVDRVFGGDPKRLAKEMGVKYDRSMDENGLMAQSESVDNRPSKKKASKKA